MDEKIPVINLEEITGESSQVLREVCKKWGCFRVVNHGVSTELMAGMKSMAKDLFDRPVEVKQRNKHVLAGTGYVAPSVENPLYEAFGVFDISKPHIVSSFSSDLQISPHQREIIEMYAQAVRKLAMEIVSKMATSLGILDYSFEDWPLQFRINKYTFTPETIGSSGVQIHTDAGFLTILQDDEVIGGVEAMSPSGTFVTVDPLPDSFLVFFGDIAVPWSNGELRNVKHRVQCKDAGIRYSIATFMSPEPDTIMETHPMFIDANHPPRYAPFTYSQLRKIRTDEKLHAGEALEHLNLMVTSSSGTVRNFTCHDK